MNYAFIGGKGSAFDGGAVTGEALENNYCKHMENTDKLRWTGSGT